MIWCSYVCNISLPSLPRLRAAVFVNLVGMRTALSDYMGPVMPEDNIRRLGDPWAAHECTCLDHVCYSVDPMSNCLTKEACYLFHCALNALAAEALLEEKLLWKIRPKVHRFLDCIIHPL